MLLSQKYILSDYCERNKNKTRKKKKGKDRRKEYQLPASDMLCKEGCHALDLVVAEFVDVVRCCLSSSAT